MSERDRRKLIALLEKQLGLQWQDIVEWLRSVNGLEEIQQRLATGRAPIVGLDDAAKALAAQIHEAYVTSGQAEAEWLDKQPRTRDVLVRFEAGHAAVVARARANELELVQGFREEQNQIAQQITQRALVEQARGGYNPRAAAADFRTAIGLTSDQEQWVANYRRSLESGDYTKALAYELSSGNVDRTVRAAQAKDRPLTPEQIDRAVEAYRQNAITYRAETIARTESMRAAHEGADEAMRQAVDRGDVRAEELIVEWHAGPATPNAREGHQELDGVTVRYGEDFVMPDGVRMSGPGDPRGGAKWCASCRCTKSTRIDLDREAP